MAPTRRLTAVFFFRGVRPMHRAARFLSGWSRLAFKIGWVLWLGSVAAALSPDDVLTIRVTSEVEGSGAVARKLAQDQAEFMALEEVIRSWIPEMDLQPFRGLIRHASAYVKQTNVLQTTRDGGRLRLEADVTLRELPLRRDLAAVLLPRLPEKPAFALIAGPVVNSGENPPTLAGRLLDPAVRRMVDTLGQLGFSGSLPEQQGELSAAVIEQAFRNSVESIGLLARQSRQPFLLACDGRVNLRPVQPDSNVLRVEAALNVRIFRAEDGKMLESFGTTSVVQSVDPTEGAKFALEDAAAKLTTDCAVTLILSASELRKEDPDAVVIMIDHPPDAESVETVAAVLRELPESRKVEVLSPGPVLARIRVYSSLRMADLADLLQQVEIGPYRLDLRKAFGREIQVVLVHR